MSKVKTRSIVWSYLDLLDPTRIYVVPSGFSKIRLASCSLDWSNTQNYVGYMIDSTLTETTASGEAIPQVANDRWFIPNAKLDIGGVDLTGTFPGEYYVSFSMTYATRVPPFVSFVIEGVDAPDNRVAVLTPANNRIDNGENGTTFNIVDKNLKIRLIDPWGNSINNCTFSATITFVGE